jgi:hypothetical protein
MERKRVVEMSKGYGKPKVGGPFYLRDLEGNEFTEKNLLGKYTLVCSNTYTIVRIADNAPDLLWFLPLPRYLPRRARQDVRSH